jgi:hypothetical protein
MILKPKVRANGYVEFTLYVAGVPAWRLAHRLVAEHFLPPAPRRPVVNHKNGDKTDNRVENLEWSTLKANNRYADARGVRHARTNPKRAHKLTAELADAIRAEHKETGRTKTIAEKFGVSDTLVREIAYGRSWRMP